MKILFINNSNCYDCNHLNFYYPILYYYIIEIKSITEAIIKLYIKIILEI